MQKPLQFVAIWYYPNRVLYRNKSKEIALANELCAGAQHTNRLPM